MAYDDVPTLEKRLETLRAYTVEDIFELSDQVLPSSRLPSSNGLSKRTCGEGQGNMLAGDSDLLVRYWWDSSASGYAT
jgi:hypothetical protein